ncbi:hypothetical protein AMECASPLE_037999 [Ameca splendens]|uniref:Uncharacterized protein n=1 Tax=Ameca splendens TaxID=208324 RepID=A0ABV0XX15_9TELE
MDMPIPVHFPLASVEEVERFKDWDKDSVHSLKQSLISTWSVSAQLRTCCVSMDPPPAVSVVLCAAINATV